MDTILTPAPVAAAESTPSLWRILQLLFTHPSRAVSQIMHHPHILSLTVIYTLLALTMTTFLMPTILAGTQEELQNSSLVEHLSSEEILNMTQLTPVRQVFGAAMFTFFSFWGIVIQAFFMYLFYATARCRGFYKEYYAAAILISFYDNLLPMLLALLWPRIAWPSLHLGLLLPSTSLFFQAFAQALDFFTLAALLIMALGISHFASIPKAKSLKFMSFYLLLRTLCIGAANLFFG